MRDAIGSATSSLGKRGSLLGAAFVSVLKEPDDALRLEGFLRYSCGAVVGGVRPAALVSLYCPRLNAVDAWNRCGVDVCADIGLRHCVLCDGKSGPLVLMYREGMLRRALFRGPVVRYLGARGYPVREGLPACLDHLRARFAVSVLGAFPHEVGVFLGYPLVDVIAFASGDRLPYACRGYWRVYHRPDRALRTFARIDDARVRSSLFPLDSSDRCGMDRWCVVSR